MIIPPPVVRVFIVDDHPMMRESLTHLIQAEPGFVVSGTAETADAAIAAIRADPPDLALVDINLRESSGLTLLQAITQQAEPVKCLVISMHDEPSVIEASLRRGARGYISKSESPEAIIRAVRMVLQGKIVATPEMQNRVRSQPEAPELAELVALLSDREREVFVRIGTGQPNRQIAEEMHLSIKTVQTFCARIKLKLNLHHATHLVAEASRWMEQQARLP